MSVIVEDMLDSAGYTKLTPLIEEAASVADEDDLGKVLRTLVAEAKASTGAPYAALGVIGEHKVLSEFIYDGVSVEQALAIGHPPVGRGLLGTLIRENQALTVDSIVGHPDSVGFPENHPPMTSFLGVPVSVGDEAFGNLYLTDKPGGFTDEDMATVQALSRIAGAAVQTARLQARLRRIAVVEDRQRIARDLHDSVIQDLFAVGLNLQGIAARITEPETAESLNESIDTLDEAVTALRRYIFELKESVRRRVELDERLQELASRMGAAYPARLVMSLENVESGPWDDEVLFLATEALSNALRHSTAENVELSVAVDDSTLVLTVSDDGIGFDPGRIDAGMGLANMRSRAQSLGGTIETTSEPGSGTTVVARLPLRPVETPS